MQKTMLSFDCKLDMKIKMQDANKTFAQNLKSAIQFLKNDVKKKKVCYN